MNIYLHIYGRRDPKEYLVWMGNGAEDGLHNFQLLAARPDNSVDAKSHLAMVDITDGIVPHLDLVSTLQAGETFRDESVYAHIFAPPAQGLPPIVVIQRAIDLEDAKDCLKGQFGQADGVNPEAYRTTVNLGDNLAILKDKIAKYFGAESMAAE